MIAMDKAQALQAIGVLQNQVGALDPGFLNKHTTNLLSACTMSDGEWNGDVAALYIQSLQEDVRFMLRDAA